MEDHIELGPDDVIREGDEYKVPNKQSWSLVRVGFGERVGNVKFEYHVFRRPRSTLIRDAAIELLRDSYLLDDTTAGAYDDIYIDVNLQLAEALREAIGISVEELRRGGG